MRDVHEFRPVYFLYPLLITAAGLYFISFTYTVGHGIDDGIHLVAAKALAMGKGLVMISDPAAPPAMQFPPAQSLFLTPIFMLWPDPPDNIIPLKSVSALFALAFVAVSWFWLRRHVPGNVAILMTCLVAFHPETIRFSGAVMAEMGYGAASLAALLLFDKAVEDQDNRINMKVLVWACVMMTVAYLFRSVGIGLLIALPGLLAIKRRWGASATMIIGFFILASPWLLQSAFLGTPEYRTQFWVLDLEDPTRGTIGLLGLFDRIELNSMTYVTETIPVHLFPILGSQRIIQFSENLGLWPVLLIGRLILTLLVMVGALHRLRSGVRAPELYMIVYFGLLMIWHTRVQWKYMAPITPILILYAYTGIVSLLDRLSERSSIKKTIIFACLGLLCISEGFRAADAVRGGQIMQGRYDPYASAYAWLKQESSEDSLLMGFDHLGLYLYTGRKSLAPAMTRDPQDSLEYIDRTGADYFIVQPRKTRNEGVSFDVKFQDPVLEKYPERFSLVFKDTENEIKVYRVNRPRLNYN
mgnify:CR=1 FL=1